MSDASAPTDALTPFVVEDAAVRGAFVTLADTAAAVFACHPYPLPVRRALGELCAASALLASTLKFHGTLAAQLSGDGPVRLLVVECNAMLGIRAMAQWDDARVKALPPQATLSDLAGGAEHGRMVLTLDPKDGGAMYQGIVALEAGSVAGMIEHYLETSEQLTSRVALVSDDRGTAGFLLQRLPGSDDDAWADASTLLATLDPRDLASKAPPAHVLQHVLPGLDLRVFDARAVSFQCTCTRERVEKALRIAGSAEIESILAEKGFVDVTCEFCNRRHVFTPVEARAALVPRNAH